MVEIHPFKNFVPQGATHLVLGSFPTLKKNWRFNSYYPGRNNFFWRLLSEIYKQPFQYISGPEAAEERLRLCISNGIAISDTIYSCRRKTATSSKDSDLIVVEKMDIIKILKQHPSIHTIILTGSSGIVSAHQVFFEHLVEKKIQFELNKSKPPIAGRFVCNGREIKTYTLYSTSGINIGRYDEALKQYRKYLPKKTIHLNYNSLKLR